LFLIATFLVASTTVPLLFKLFVYIKYLFSLERKTFYEIRAEAETFFLKLYNYRYTDAEQEKLYEEDVGGGIYYLFLKTIHKIKDQGIAFFSNLIKRPPHQFKPSQVLDKINQVKEKIVTQFETRRQIKVTRLVGPFMALIFTFAVAAFLVYGNAHGEGIIASLVLSVVDKQEALTIWTNYHAHLGYFQSLVKTIGVLPNFFMNIGWFLDFILYYFFIFWHTFFPFYLSFIAYYYKLILKIVGIKLT
jgi:hypothetical protein